MHRSLPLIVSFGFMVGLAIGCDPLTPSAKYDLPAAEAKLAALEKSMAAKEKELADLRGEAGALRAAKGEAAPPLADLLGKLPKERWPKDKTDTLRFEQATEWFKYNIVGQRASWTCVDASGLTFTSEGGGKYSASLTSDKNTPFLKLYGSEWGVNLQTGDFLPLYGAHFAVKARG